MTWKRNDHAPDVGVRIALGLLLFWLILAAPRALLDPEESSRDTVSRSSSGGREGCRHQGTSSPPIIPDWTWLPAMCLGVVTIAMAYVCGPIQPRQ